MRTAFLIEPGEHVKRFHLFLKVVAASIILATPAVIGAAVVEATGTVTLILTYLNSQGDFTFRVTNPPTGCTGGFWISPSQPGFSRAVAFVMQAKATGEPVFVGADTAELWGGSGPPWCKVNYVGTPGY
jgi:hypothetical protein